MTPPPRSPSGEVVLAALAVIIVLAAAVMATIGLIGDLRDGHTLARLQLAGSAVAVLAVVAAVLWIRAQYQARQTLRGAMTARVHAHGARPASGLQRFIGRHEVGHVVGAERTGMGVDSVEIGDGWGEVHADRFVSVPASITFLAAGHLAVDSRRGASADLAEIRRLARLLPHETRARDLRAAIDEARRIVREDRGRIRRDGHRLADTGRWDR